MGQYHHPVCIEALESLNPHGLDSGIKEWEQWASRPGTPNLIAALVCARGGNMPADCSQSTLVGRWAGKRVLVQGDYAEDDDIPNWDGPPLSMIYGSCGSDEDERRSRKLHYGKMMVEYKDNPSRVAEFEKAFNAIDTMPFFADITREARDFLEGACNLRYFEETQQIKNGTTGEVTDSWTSVHSVRVRPLAREFGDSGVAEYIIDPSYDVEGLIWLKKHGLSPGDIMRPPRDGGWHGFRESEIAEGNARVLVNLDTLEYINPVAFGQVPTLVGLVRPPPADRKVPFLSRARKDMCDVLDAAGGLFVLLCHPERRGGGDLPANADEISSIDAARAKHASAFKGVEDIKGRWRGGRIYGTLERAVEIDEVEYPSTEEVLEKGTDISRQVMKYLAAVSHY